MELIICQSCKRMNAATETRCRYCGLPLLAVGQSQPGAFATEGDTPRGLPVQKHTLTPPSIAKTESDGSTTELATTVSYTSRQEKGGEVPLTLSAYFPRVLVAGHLSTVHFKIQNLSDQSLEQVEIILVAKGLQESAKELVGFIAPQEQRHVVVELIPAQPGPWVMTYSLKLKKDVKWLGLIGTKAIWINPVPSSFPFSLGQVRINRGPKGCLLLEAAKSDADCASLLAQPPAASVTDLLKLKLPEKYEPMELAFDYALSVEAEENARQQQTRQLIIPVIFAGHVQTGAVLRLLPIKPPNALAQVFIARSQFKIGRSRKYADFVTWLLPQNPANYERTMKISRVQVLAECRDGRLYLRDADSKSGSSFDGPRLPSEKWEPITRRAALTLADEYFLDVQPFASAYPSEPPIKNLSVWKGPSDYAPPLARGCVRFVPINSSLVDHNAVWIFTDATFGSSQTNPVHFQDDSVAEIQGRFLYFRGAFWLENCIDNSSVRINGQNLKADEIVPLIAGDLVQIGTADFQVEIQS